METERRRYNRKIWASDITFKVAREDGFENIITHRGQIKDISAGGIGVRSESQLEPGCLVFFGETRLSGVVKWSCQSGSLYSAGIQLF